MLQSRLGAVLQGHSWPMQHVAKQSCEAHTQYGRGQTPQRWRATATGMSAGISYLCAATIGRGFSMGLRGPMLAPLPKSDQRMEHEDKGHTPKA